MRREAKRASSLVAIVVTVCFLANQSCNWRTSNITWTVDVADRYRISANIPYTSHNDKLDVYIPKAAGAPSPTVIYFHYSSFDQANQFRSGSKDSEWPNILPYLEMNSAVVNVEYLPSCDPSRTYFDFQTAIENCRCALRWVTDNQGGFNFDVTNIVVVGRGMGGYLSLMTGLLPERSEFDNSNRCPAGGALKVSAIVNWYGATELDDVRFSPIRYVNSSSPPVLAIHGDADLVAPYSQTVRLHEALMRLNLPD